MPPVLWALIGVFIIIAYVIYWGISLTRYQYFEKNFEEGLLLYRLEFDSLDIDWTLGRTYGFMGGFVKVVDVDRLFVRGTLRSEESDSFRLSERKTMFMGVIRKSTNGFILEIRVSWTILFLFSIPSFLACLQFFTESSVWIQSLLASFIFLFFALIPFYYLRRGMLMEATFVCRQFSQGLPE
ncbi:hypothetical protein EHQ61_12205 [Leptospira wolffii]|uniref:hypothetical protein n=1 Tax=Leptospira wolffii TaxID=409998 RepID=UPI001083ED1B|nr:hypothetical protein [Leptospira wolffii]TGL49221.1 hypothetical protein EHQ61_12205 [Leptospira wolffii]